jgi:hypothetical protein
MPSPKGDVIFDHRHNAALRASLEQRRIHTGIMRKPERPP